MISALRAFSGAAVLLGTLGAEDVIGTDSTDLDGFIDRKAKNITYHGVADQLIFSRGTTNYF